MTEVQHGPNPKFKAKLAEGRYSATIVGHYTTTPGLTAGGVTVVEYASTADAKRRAELLGMRTMFLEWWMDEWLKQGGDGASGELQIRQFPFAPR